MNRKGRPSRTWLLNHLASGPRTESLIGDLIEQHPARTFCLVASAQATADRQNSHLTTRPRT